MTPGELVHTVSIFVPWPPLKHSEGVSVLSIVVRDTTTLRVSPGKENQLYQEIGDILIFILKKKYFYYYHYCDLLLKILHSSVSLQARVEEEEDLIPPLPFSLPGLYGEGGWRGGGRISFITWGWREEGRGRSSYSE